MRNAYRHTPTQGIALCSVQQPAIVALMRCKLAACMQCHFHCNTIKANAPQPSAYDPNMHNVFHQDELGCSRQVKVAQLSFSVGVGAGRHPATNARLLFQTLHLELGTWNFHCSFSSIREIVTMHRKTIQPDPKPTRTANIRRPNLKRVSCLPPQRIRSCLAYLNPRLGSSD